MKGEFDLQRLNEIPDPFVEANAPSRGTRPERKVYSPPRSRVRAIRALGAAAALSYVAAWPILVGGRADLASVPAVELALQLGVPLLLAVVAVGVVGRYGRSGVGERVGHLRWLVAFSPLVFAVAMFMTLRQGHVDRFWHHTVACLLTTAILAAGPLAVAAYAFRHAFATLAAWRTAALGLASGALAAAAIALACPISNVWHVLVGHGAVMLVAGAVGALLGQRVCRA